MRIVQPMEETGAERFHRLMQARTEHVLRGIGLMGHLAYDPEHEWTSAQASAYITTIRIALYRLERDFKIVP